MTRIANQPVKQGVPAPKKLDDGSRDERCERCGLRIGYADFTAEIVDDARRGLVWGLTHVTDCSEWS